MDGRARAWREPPAGGARDDERNSGSSHEADERETGVSKTNDVRGGRRRRFEPQSWRRRMGPP